MIWLVKQLSDVEKNRLRALEPFVAVHRSKGYVHWRTSFRGWEIRLGVYQEIRRVRIDPIDNICGGLICDDAEEALIFIDDFVQCGASMPAAGTISPDVHEHCRALGTSGGLWVAAPVRSVFAYFSQAGSHHLDHFDPEELRRKWRIDVTDYLSRE